MDETKVQIGDDVLLDIGIHSDWYINAICYDNESVNVELRRKKGLQLFADILFDKEKSEQFLKECKAMGIDPLTERSER